MLYNPIKNTNSNHRYSSKVCLFLMSIILVSFIDMNVRNVRAEVPLCRNLNDNPPVGSTCYTESPYNARIENSKQPAPFEIIYTAPPGYVIIDTQNIEEGRGGNTSGPVVTILRPGTSIQIRRAYENAFQEFSDFYQRTEAEVRIKGINFGGMSDIKQRTEEQFKSAINQLSQIQSASEAIQITGSAQAVWRTWLGVTEYTKGGTLRGVIRVYQRYIGTPSQANKILVNAKNQILALTGSQGNAQPLRGDPVGDIWMVTTHQPGTPPPPLRWVRRGTSATFDIFVPPYVPNSWLGTATFTNIVPTANGSNFTAVQYNPGNQAQCTYTGQKVGTSISGNFYCTSPTGSSQPLSFGGTTDK
jgi:hypothetical protein